MSNELEQQLTDLQTKYEQTQSALDETRKQLESAERRRKIDQALVEADAVDLEAARLLTEVTIGVMDNADVKSAVDELRRRKPFLFRREGGAPPGGAMSARPRHRASSELTDAAQAAATTGDRRDLLRYLRLRRKAS